MAIAFACPECEHDLKVKEQLAGRRIRCPECGGVVAVPTENGAAIAEGPPRRGAADEEDRPRKKKKKKKKKSNTVLFIRLGVLAGLLIVLAVLLIILLNRGDDDGNKQAKGDPKKPEPPEVPIQNFQPAEPPPKAPATGIRRAPERTEVSNALRQIGLAYHNYVGINNRAPQKWQDLEPLVQSQAISEMLKTKYLTFLYGATPTQMPQGTSNTVLAYETQLDQQRIRIVLMGDGSVTFMNDAEFNAAPKAGQR